MHKLYQGPEYRSWHMMKQRCLNSNFPKYPTYGGRGISVCERWLDFWNFYEDMGPRPVGMSLDRIDNDGNYEPNNCRWTTATEQCRNQRLRKDNTSGIKGVGFNKAANKWIATLYIDGKLVFYRRFKEKKDAMTARQGAELVYFGG